MKSPVRSPQAPGQSARGRAYDRHSAMGTRGLPKKNGAGGKGVWGSMLDQEGDAPIDKNDPNYDSGDEAAAAAEPPAISLTEAPEPPARVVAGQKEAEKKAEDGGSSVASSAE